MVKALLLLLAVLTACSGTAEAPSSCPVPTDQFCGQPHCEVAIADGACSKLTNAAEILCDRPLTTLDQDCANINGPHVSCLAVTPTATSCIQPAGSDGTVWCCR